LDLADDVAGSVVVANLLGLGYVRLMDDCRDGENPGLGFADMNRLAHVLYDAAISTYVDLIGTNPWFWNQVESLLSEWRRVRSDHTSFDALQATDAEMQQLAQVGSPLHIGSAALCAVAGQDAAA
jgi:hypothetical protein